MPFLHECPHGRDVTTALDVSLYVFKSIPDAAFELVPNGA